ncbi:MAG TPA: polyhydroxyalkanoic acid system family protein [Polyangiaceae bacterium]|nr:polyhydroxyalkanoic acid system family protein [Polyangiaceae bacterium]HOD24088.1 polyhydroxyalkanoic acid system family protein [Polyangiaceae bacterium]HOE51614.1 polyhydroxyalkanoic acid system family protein [Polyangiaceae bacterium]HOH02775.1 polyhydroxyalkanoic acid system family protein [Polyangiaceae bacterium]HOR37397.1 polyhydroxyalkanoic acid system family protein [Polyangiaceae bacterium]
MASPPNIQFHQLDTAARPGSPEPRLPSRASHRAEGQQGQAPTTTERGWQAIPYAKVRNEMGLPWLDVSQGRYYLFAPMSFRIDHAHSLPLEQAVERIRALGDYLNNKHGIGVTWTGPHTAHVKGNFMVVKIDATVSVETSKVVFDGKDPGMLWRGKAREYLERKMRKYLDPSCPVSELPRS